MGPITRFANRCRELFDGVRHGRASVLLVGASGGLVAWASSLVARQAWGHCATQPFGFLDLELTFSPRVFAALLDRAGACRDGITSTFVSSDLFFPFTYALFLSALYLWAERCRRFQPTAWTFDTSAGAAEGAPAEKRSHRLSTISSLLVVLPFGCAAVDILLENLPLFGAARLGEASPFFAPLVFLGSYGSALKWTLLALFALGILYTTLSEGRGTVLWRVRFSALAVLLGGVPLLAVPQGQDILQRIVEGDDPVWRVLFAVLFIALSALVIWYCARTLSRMRFPHDDARDDPWLPFFERNIPRIVGIAILLVTGIAFARAAGATGRFIAVAAGTYLLVGVLALFIPAVLHAIGRKLARLIAGHEVAEGDTLLTDRLGRATIGVAATLLMVPESLWPFTSGHDRAPDAFALRMGAALLVAVAWLLYLFVYFRRDVMVLRREKSLDKLAAARKTEREELAAGFPGDKLPAAVLHWLIRAAVLSAVFLYVFTAHAVGAGRMLGPIAVLSVAAANTVFVGSLLAWLGRKYRTPLVTILVALAAAFSLWNDNHAIRTIPAPARAAADSAPHHLSGRLDLWLGARAAEHPGGDSIPLVLVATAGGGLRASYWTLASLAAIQDRDTTFTRHLFAISGVSGGSVGAAMFAAMMHDRTTAGAIRACGRDRAAPPVVSCARRLMRDDYLSPLLAMFLGPDMFQSFLPFPVPPFDRSLAIEGSFERSYSDAMKRATLDSGFLALQPDSVARWGVPALLLNTTNVETGRRYVTVPFDTGGVFSDVLSVTDVLRADLRLSTAAHNSARFPFVSPAGRIARDSGGHYGSLVDGGYFENSGLVTLGEVRRELKRLLSLESGEPLLAAARRVKIVMLYLCNDPAECRLEEDGTISVDMSRTSLGEWLTPLRAMLSTRDARGSLARTEAARRDAGGLIQLNVCGSLDDGARAAAAGADSAKRVIDRERVVNPPLGWSLSHGARSWMDSSLVLDTTLVNVDSLAKAGNCRLRNVRALDQVVGVLRRGS
ncbi:MAG: hypothetical protein ACHQQ3_03990 [Gemmatimonadales bacterium]